MVCFGSKLNQTWSHDLRTCVSSRDTRASSNQQGFEADHAAHLKDNAWSLFSDTMDIRVIPLTIEDGGFMHKSIKSMLQNYIRARSEPNSREIGMNLAYWKQRLLLNNMKGVAMTILSQHPTCRNPTCINRIDTHRFSLLPIGRNVHHTSNMNLQSPTVTPNPSQNSLPNHDQTSSYQVPNPSDPTISNLTPAPPITHPSHSNYLNIPPSNNPFHYSFFHNSLLNPTNIPITFTPPTPYSSSTIQANLPNQIPSLWSTSSLSPSTFIPIRSSISNQGRANSCVFDQPLN